MLTRPLIGLLATMVFVSAPAAPAAAPEDDAAIVPREGLVLPRIGWSGGRSLLGRDPVAAEVAMGTWSAPREGETVSLPGGPSQPWQALLANAEGAFTHSGLRGGYAYLPVRSEAGRVMILQASDYSLVYVHGEPRVGDVYGHGYVRIPVKLETGTNDFLFQGGRKNTLRVQLDPPKAEVYLETADTTLPDLIVGEPVATWGSLLVINASEVRREGLRLRVKLAGATTTTDLPALVPLGTRKVAFRLDGPAPQDEAAREAVLELDAPGDDGSAKPLDTIKVTLAVRRPEAQHKRTFVSEIDGSVQYYGVVPVSTAEGAGSKARPGLILTLHGAGVEGIGQANVYAPKPWAHVVAATNRRPYGFDWEDWGRLDALEVLANVRRRLDPDPRRIYLTGHSMGGHGTWYLGATYPDLFAAIAPSAGWISMWTYAGAKGPQKGSGPEALVERAARTSDTLALLPNLRAFGIYILHGDRDDNVPVDQARAMRRHLGEFHADFAYYEQPGAGHWWGDACCDWPPLMQFLARHEKRQPEEVRKVDFVTTNPGISSRLDWATIEAQIRPLVPSAIHLAYDPDRRQFSGTTENVARMALDLGHIKPGREVEVVLDHQTICGLPRPQDAPRVWLSRVEDGWIRIDEPSPSAKGPHRNGPFKDAFRHRFQLVYGTGGSPDENAWALAKARYDAEVFWYRGNGSVDVLPDTAFDPDAERDRGVILYGNADTNRAWPALLEDCPVHLRHGRVRVADRELVGDDLACLFLRPRPGSDRACVGVVGGTGVLGMRLTDRLPYFVSGVGLPDLTIFGADAPMAGFAGLRAAGYFGNDWGVASGEFTWPG